MYELSRISDHILCAGLQAMDLGAFSAMLWAFIEREKLYDVFELASGGRLTTSYTRVGGLAFDAPEDLVPRVKAFLPRLDVLLKEMEGILAKNRIFLDRTKDVGVLTKADAIAFGVTGPLARASGIDRDLRRDRPYGCYSDFQFEVPIQTEGDWYARFIQRLRETKQAARIVEQAIAKLPSGPVNALDEKVVLPGKDAVYTKMESLIHHFMLSMPGHGHRTPVGEIYHATESPNGELGWFLVGDGTAVPYRVRVRPPSFFNYQAMQRMVAGRPRVGYRRRPRKPQRDRRRARPMSGAASTEAAPVAEKRVFGASALQESQARDRAPAHALPDQARGAAPVLRLAEQDFGMIDTGGMRLVAEHARADAGARAGSLLRSTLITAGRRTASTSLKSAGRCLAHSGARTRLPDWSRKKLGIRAGETTKDGKFTLKDAECQAACDKAPVCQVNALYHENLTIDKFREIVKGLP